MAAFDRKHGHIVVRVVYDGPSGAGKTSNLEQLVQSFSAQRRGELSSPRSTPGEATRYFDWLYFNGGVVAGHALRAQLVTVPGLATLERRRRQILATADVVVFVCESSPTGVAAARARLLLFRAHFAGRREPPLVLQANKQDAADAMPAAALVDALGSPPGTEVVAASATAGEGVRETVVRAIRAAAALAEREIVERGVDGLALAGSETELLAALDGTDRLRSALGGGAGGAPTLPCEDAPHDALWPARGARRLVRGLMREVVEGQGLEASVERGWIQVRVGSFRLRTSRQPYVDAAAARLAMLERARQHLTARASAEAVAFALARADDGATWLWELTTLDAARAPEQTEETYARPSDLPSWDDASF